MILKIGNRHQALGTIWKTDRIAFLGEKEIRMPEFGREYIIRVETLSVL